MRNLKIATKEKDSLELENITEEHQFIAALARRYATTPEELHRYFQLGVTAADNFRKVVDTESYHSKVAFIVDQVMKQEKLASS